MADELIANPDFVKREVYEAAVEGRREFRAMYKVARNKIASLSAQLKTAREALTQAEACMSIVQPRSDTAEYLRILGVVRAALTGGE